MVGGGEGRRNVGVISTAELKFAIQKQIIYLCSLTVHTGEAFFFAKVGKGPTSTLDIVEQG